jgi:hypothetical protein
VLAWTAAPWADAAAVEPTRLAVGVALDSPFMLPFYLVAERTARVRLHRRRRHLSTLVNLVLAGQRAKRMRS